MTVGDRTHAVVSVGGVERAYDLTERDELTIGRRDCDVTLLQGSVSPKHARLVRVGGVWHVEDLDSVNGTFVADAKITPHEHVALTAQSVVRVCDAFVRVRTVEAPAPPPQRKSSKSSSYGPFVPVVIIALGVVVVAAYSCNAKHEAHDGHGQEHKR